MKVIVIENSDPIGINLQSIRNGKGAYVHQFYRQAVDKKDQVFVLHGDSTGGGIEIGDLVSVVNGEDVSQDTLETIKIKCSASRPLTIGFKSPAIDSDIEFLFQDSRKLHGLLDYFLAANQPSTTMEINLCYEIYCITHNAKTSQGRDSDISSDNERYFNSFYDHTLILNINSALHSQQNDCILQQHATELQDSVAIIAALCDTKISDSQDVDPLFVLHTIEVLYQRLHNIANLSYNEFKITPQAAKMSAYYSCDRQCPLLRWSLTDMLANNVCRLWLYVFAVNNQW